MQAAGILFLTTVNECRILFTTFFLGIPWSPTCFAGRGVALRVAAHFSNHNPKLIARVLPVVADCVGRPVRRNAPCPSRFWPLCGPVLHQIISSFSFASGLGETQILFFAFYCLYYCFIVGFEIFAKYFFCISFQVIWHFFARIFWKKLENSAFWPNFPWSHFFLSNSRHLDLT